MKNTSSISNATAEHAWARFLSQSTTASADDLEATPNVTTLVRLADGPWDACQVVLDLVAFKLHVDERHRARRRGEPAPQPPAPVSKLLTGFTAILRDKLLTIVALLEPTEVTRLVDVSPGMVASLDKADTNLVTLVAELLRTDAAAVAIWLRMHLEEIERRFAS